MTNIRFIQLDALVNAKPGFASGDNPTAGVFQIRMNNVTSEGQLDLSRRRRVPTAAKNLSPFLLQRGDVLFNATNSPELVGKAAYFDDAGEPTVFSNHFLRLRPASMDLDGRYLHRWLNLQYQRQVFAGVCKQWVNQATISRESLLSMSIPLPTLTRQRRIADILDSADALRAKRRAALAQLDALTQSIFIDVFGDPVSNPKNWDEDAKLGEVAEIVSGITKGRQVKGATRDVPYLAVINVQDRALNLATVKRIAATDAEIQRYRLERNDLLLTEGGDPDKLGRGSLWMEELPLCIHQNHIFRVRLTSDVIEPVYLNWLIGSERGKRYFLKSAKQTTGIASINMTQLRGFPLLMPPVALQREFAQRLAAVADLSRRLTTSRNALDDLFASLQHRAFRGEL